ncbi:hypothetical protein NPIL_434911 [Nephila pilipes]|uniref:Uncharacterized protein n=1 Tax=Nephila pilipes TaxID=299642 RepID=A0A8X6QTH7_NEPPI|nr:hypothetical protein NPIL_434911 [Nephila pilipes]
MVHPSDQVSLFESSPWLALINVLSTIRQRPTPYHQCIKSESGTISSPTKGCDHASWDGTKVFRISHNRPKIQCYFEKEFTGNPY